MEERKITICLNGENHSVFAGNASLRRFRKAGGCMSSIEGIDTESDQGIDDVMDMLDSLALFIHANLVEPGSLTIDDLINGFEDMSDMSDAVQELFIGVPWLKNQAATGSGSK